jgi:hypothetical protein
MILAFVRMGGESRPWGIAFGHPHEEPSILTVPEGRNRDLVAGMAARFAPALLSHLRSPALMHPPTDGTPSLLPVRQVWLPNPSHLEMLHHLAYAYTFTRSGDEAQGTLNALGRACSWLFRSAQRPGGQVTVVATRALREAFRFPAEDVRQGHLGYLMAWFGGEGRPATNEALHDAERLSIATTLDPAVERGFESFVDAWHERQGDAEAQSQTARQIHDGLAPELRRRFALTVAAWDLLRTDGRSENRFVGDLVEDSVQDQWWNWGRIEAAFAQGERPYVASVETDRDPRGAAAAYEEAAAAAELVRSKLLHDDQELLAEAIADGDAFAGTIVRVDDEGIGRTTVPVWTIEDRSGGPLRIREGSSVCVVGLPNRTGQVREIRSGHGAREFDVVLTNLKTKPKQAVGQLAVPANDPAWVGQRVAFAEAGGSFAIAKRNKLWAPDQPGAWLTQSRPSPRLRAVPDADPEVA